jgi:fructoselysine 6-phosphate deglycase
MQWVHSAAIHSGEYFHGPFEITDYDVPFLLMKTAGETRPLDERALAFATKFSKKLTVVDAEDFDWTGIDASLKSYLSAPIFGAVLRVYAERLAEHRGHPLSVRRYMWKMEY